MEIVRWLGIAAFPKNQNRPRLYFQWEFDHADVGITKVSGSVSLAFHNFGSKREQDSKERLGTPLSAGLVSHRCGAFSAVPLCSQNFVHRLQTIQFDCLAMDYLRCASPEGCGQIPAHGLFGRPGWGHYDPCILPQERNGQPLGWKARAAMYSALSWTFSLPTKPTTLAM